jgi:hypothetical protein
LARVSAPAVLPGVVLLGLGLVAGCGTASRRPARPGGAIPRPARPATPIGGRVPVATGTRVILAAQSFTERGFHDGLTITTRLRVRGPLLRGPATVLLTLRDASRPRQTCTENHPLSGCVTVDWSDDPARPHVPPSGVFTNALTVQTARGSRTLYLHPAGTLTARAEPFAPG